MSKNEKKNMPGDKRDLTVCMCTFELQEYV